jgi:hypothetical protein
MTDEPSDPVETRARLFESMAAQIRLNKDAKFGGALLAIPPGDADPFSFLTFNQAHEAIFWSVVQTLSQMAMTAMEEAARGQFGRR